MEQFSLGAYAAALLQGADLAEAQKKEVAAKLESYTGVPAAYWIKANLRVSGGEFSKELQSEMGITTGRLDTRYEGPDLDPQQRGRVRSLRLSYIFGLQHCHQPVRPHHSQVRRESDLQAERAQSRGFNWDLKRVPPGDQGWDDSSVNVMPDLAMAMKRNPKLKVLLMGGYYDLGCTYFGAIYEDKHLQIPGRSGTTSTTASSRPDTWSTSPRPSERTPRRDSRLHPQYRRRRKVATTHSPFIEECHSVPHVRGPADNVRGVSGAKNLLL